MRVIMICKRKTAQAANSASNSPFSPSATVTPRMLRNTVFPAHAQTNRVKIIGTNNSASPSLLVYSSLSADDSSLLHHPVSPSPAWCIPAGLLNF